MFSDQQRSKLKIRFKKQLENSLYVWKSKKKNLQITHKSVKKSCWFLEISLSNDKLLHNKTCGI